MTACLQLDVGNSGAKWRLLRAGEVVERGLYRTGDDESERALLACADRVDRIWIASVGAAERDAELAALLSERWGVTPWFATTPAQTGDLVNSYSEPQRMGVDRWLAMLGARARSGERLCVVDVGSAMTIDFVAAGGTHEGGYIIPGPLLMRSALLRDTQRVRFEDTTQLTLEPGTDTGQAVQHGIALALCGAVSLAVQRAEASEASPEVFVTGGGGDLLAGLLAIPAEYVQDLVFEGLSILGDSVAD